MLFARREHLLVRRDIANIDKADSTLVINSRNSCLYNPERKIIMIYCNFIPCDIFSFFFYCCISNSSGKAEIWTYFVLCKS